MSTIDSRWVFRVKTDQKEQTNRYKTRLCARGFMQKQGIDYTETFASVVRYDSLRVFLAVVAKDDLELRQVDVQTAFLYGQLEENIYIGVPDGLKKEEPRKSAVDSVVCKLEKSLYGLKQSLRCWNRRFTQFLNEFEFKECEADPCVFTGRFEGESVFLALFVNEGLVAARSKKILNYIINRLNETFKVQQ